MKESRTENEEASKAWKSNYDIEYIEKWGDPHIRSVDRNRSNWTEDDRDSAPFPRSDYQREYVRKELGWTADIKYTKQTKRSPERIIAHL